MSTMPSHRTAAEARSSAFVLAFGLALSLAGCDSKEPGYVALTFKFSERPAAIVLLWFRVEARDGSEARPLGGSGPIAFDPAQEAPLELELLEIPAGGSRVVIVSS